MEKHPVGNEEEKAGIGSRFTALLIDGVMLAIVLVATMTLLTFVLPLGTNELPMLVVGLQLVAVVATFSLPIVMEAVWGYTPGKYALGLVVKKEDGSDVGWVESLIRNLLRIVDALPTFYLVGAFTIFATDDRQRLGDVAASTIVVDRR